jgi:hypothetical protein
LASDQISIHRTSPKAADFIERCPQQSISVAVITELIPLAELRFGQCLAQLQDSVNLVFDWSI